MAQLAELLTVSMLLMGACTPAAESGTPSEADKPARAAEPEPESDPPGPTTKPEPVAAPAHAAQPVETANISVSADAAVAAGLPGLGFSLDTSGTGMSGSKLGDGVYVQLSGPPGGPMSLRISPATVGAEFREVIAGGQLGEVIQGPLLDDQVTLLGKSRPAVAWITGEGMARTSWCAVLIGPDDASPKSPALLLEVGTGHSGDAIVCATVVENPSFAAMLASFELH